LSKKIERIIQLNDAQRHEMGRCGREKMELQFDEQIMVQKYLTTISRILLG